MAHVLSFFRVDLFLPGEAKEKRSSAEVQKYST